MGIQINGQTDTISAVDNSFSLAGNVSIGGTLTYEDVTSVDAVGLSTFQAGIQLDDSITHLGDTDTKIRFPAADTFAVETAGSERLRITSAGDVGIGTDNPEYLTTIAADGASAKLNIKRKTAATNGNAFGSLFYTNSDGTDVASVRAHRESAADDAYLGFATRNTGGSLSEKLRITSDGYARLVTANARLEWTASSGSNPFIRSIGSGQQSLEINTGGSERLRIDSSGRILVGTDTAPTVNVTSSALLVVEGYTGVPTGDALISLQRGQAPASISSGAQLGGINFGASDGSRYAQIHVNSDGAGGTNDYPGRLIFSTTANSSATPTERLRITSGGKVKMTSTTNNQRGLSVIAPQTQINFGISEDVGGFLMSSNNGQFGLSGGGYWNGSNWIATNSGSAQIRHDGGGDMVFCTNASLTSGNNFTPTERLRITSGGQIQATSASDVRLTLGSGGTAGTNDSVHVRADGANLLFMNANTGITKFESNGTETLRVENSGNVSVNWGNPNSWPKVTIRDAGSNISSTGNAINGSTMKGVHLANSSNDDTSIGIWSTNGDSHWSGISFQRNDSASTWGTDIRFYTHEGSTNDLTYARARLRINPQGMLVNHKGQNAVDTGGSILGRYKYTQVSQGQNYEHKILGPDGRKLQDFCNNNVYAVITIITTGTGSMNMFCQYEYFAISNGQTVNLTHLRGNSGSSSNRPYMVLDSYDPCWKMNHSGTYTMDIEVALYGGKSGYTYTPEFGNFTSNP